MRFHWLLFSILSTLLIALPAEAGRLLFWRFESNQNRLVFTTDERVQPRAQLIPDPTRVVIDLPGIILGRPSVDQAVGGIIRSVRVGQFNPQTARLVIELAPGYTIDPQAVKIRGVSPTQWTVDLPAPQRIPPPSTNPLPTPPSTPPIPPTTTPSPSPSPTTGASGNSALRVTRNGIFINLDRNGDKQRMRVKRDRDRTKIDMELPGAKLPTNLVGQTVTINEYGISDIQFEQENNAARLILSVSKESPDWQAVYSRFDGLVLLPKGGFNNLDRSSLAQPVSFNTAQSSTIPQYTTISGVQLSSNNAHLVVSGDRSFKGTGGWNARDRTYEIRIPEAQLAQSVQGPQLGQTSPIYQLKVRQEPNNTVVIQVQPALGVQFGNLSQPNPQQLALEVKSLSGSSPRPVTVAPRPIPVTPPPTTALPTTPSWGTPSTPSVPQGRVLVVIDPGHGGKDPGAVGLGGLQEKNVILPISQEVASILQQQGIRVQLTRTSDYFVGLKGRTDLANRIGADLFISIHANAVGGGRTDVNGVEVYYYGNRNLASTIHSNIMRRINIRDRGVRQARFYVLRNSRMPASLVEVGFVTGNEDNAKLRNPVFRSQMAAAIAQGILEYVQQNRL